MPRRQPLYPGALSPCQDIDGGSGVSAAAGAGGPAGLANADAERTLLRIKQKLEGVEAGGWRAVAETGTQEGGARGLCRLQEFRLSCAACTAALHA